MEADIAGLILVSVIFTVWSVYTSWTIGNIEGKIDHLQEITFRLSADVNKLLNKDL